MTTRNESLLKIELRSAEPNGRTWPLRAIKVAAAPSAPKSARSPARSTRLSALIPGCLLFAFLLTGCASLQTPSAPPLVPASLREPCPQLQPPTDGSGATLLRTFVEWATAYRECASRHQALVEATSP